MSFQYNLQLALEVLDSLKQCCWVLFRHAYHGIAFVTEQSPYLSGSMIMVYTQNTLLGVIFVKITDLASKVLGFLQSSESLQSHVVIDEEACFAAVRSSSF